MRLWDFFQNLYHQEAEHKLRVNIGPERCSREFEATEVRAGEHYVRIHLAQMFLRDRQVFLNQYRPAVHSLVTLTMGDEPTQIPNVADSSKIALKDVGSAAVIDHNYPLTPPLPFNGGDLGIDAGLISVRVGNTLERYLNTLSKFSDLLNVTQLSSVLKIAEPLALGIQNLFSDGNGRMHLGFHDSYSARSDNNQLVNPLRQGYIALVDATTHGPIDTASLLVHEDSLHVGSSLTDGAHAPLTGYDYLLLRIEVFTERDDWRSLSAIADPCKQALTALSDPNIVDPEAGKEPLKRALLFLRQAQLQARSAPELTLSHRRIVVKRLQAMFDEAKLDAGVAMGLTEASEGEDDAGPLARAMAGVSPETIAAEARRGEMSEEEIFEMG